MRFLPTFLVAQTLISEVVILRLDKIYCTWCHKKILNYFFFTKILAATIFSPHQQFDTEELSIIGVSPLNALKSIGSMLLLALRMKQSAIRYIQWISTRVKGQSGQSETICKMFRVRTIPDRPNHDRSGPMSITHLV